MLDDYLNERQIELEETNDDICDILDSFFNTIGQYPDTKHYRN